MPGTKLLPAVECPGQYVFCIEVEPGNPGPYLETSGGTAQLYMNAYIETLKGKLDKKASTYFDPNPGDPVYQYITFNVPVPKKEGKVKYSDYYCIGFSPSACDNGAYTFIIGIALGPNPS